MGAVILVTQGAERFEAISDLLAGGMQLLVDRLLLFAAQLDSSTSSFARWSAPPRSSVPGLFHDCRPRRPCGSGSLPAHRSPLRRCAGQRLVLVRSLALQLFAGISLGSFCNHGFGFITVCCLKLSSDQLPAGCWRVGYVRDQNGDSTPVSLVFFDSSVAAVVFFQEVPEQQAAACGASRAFLRSGRRGCAAQKFLPDYVRLPNGCGR